MKKKFLLLLGASLVALLVLLGLWNAGVSRVPSDIDNARHFVDFGLSAAINRFVQDVGRYPTNEETLQILVDTEGCSIDGWNGPYVEAIPVDPWGNNYRFGLEQSEGNYCFRLRSLGADGVQSQDDLIGRCRQSHQNLTARAAQANQ